MNYPIYNHNREIYISVPANNDSVLSTGNIVCSDDRALFTVKIQENGQTLETILSNRPGFITTGKLHILELYNANNQDHVRYLKCSVMESPQFISELGINFYKIDCSSNGEVLRASYNLPAQQKFVHINTLSLTYSAITDGEA